MGEQSAGAAHASNYDQQRPGISAAESLAETKIGTYSAYKPALEAAWRVGHMVVQELTRRWDEYRKGMPAATPQPGL